MGLLSSLFKKNDSNFSETTAMIGQKVGKVLTDVSKKGTADANGLYPADLIMLYLAHKYKTNETDFPKYLKNEYEISNPNAVLSQLEEQGFIRKCTAVEGLAGLKVTELKEIAEEIGTESKKTKAALVEALSEIGEEDLAQYIQDKHWVVTEAGENALNSNRYIEFFFERHKYSLKEIGITFWDVSKAVNKNPKMRYRDCIWHLINQKENEISIAIQSKKDTSSAATDLYCNIYRTMALFVEEEKQYTNAADYYFQYLYKWVNIHRGLELINGYRYAQNKKGKNIVINSFYEDSKLYPYQSDDILRLKEELNLDDVGLRKMMRTSFQRSRDTGVFTYDEFTEFVMFELNGQCNKSKSMCTNLALAMVGKAGLR